MQVCDVSEFSHGIRLDGESLTGFDIDPGDGWQYWMDTISAGHLQAGDNTIQFRRDTETDDAFVVGPAVVHWTEPVE